ncbi:MAG: ribosome maturation factor RimM [Acidimicrobiales bacterium]
MSDPAATPRLAVGRIDRAHGLRGELVLTLTTNRLERVAAGALLYTDDEVLTVESAQPHLGRFIVRFVDVRTRADADRLHGAPLYADAIDDPGEWWVHDLIGAMVIDQHGVEQGRVVEVQANPASDLLVLDTGALVPLRFAIELTANERVAVDAPEGLFDESLRGPGRKGTSRSGE